MLLNPLFPLALSLTVGVSAAVNPKRGIAFADDKHPTDISKLNVGTSVISWIYDWSNSPNQYITSSKLPFVPMQWGPNGVQSIADTIKKQGAKVILGFNEPDLSSQSNMTPKQAADLYKQYITPLKASGVRLGAPAITNAPTGRPWLADFLSNCAQCGIDFIPIHWYGDGLGPFYDHLWSVHGQFPGYPIWITEFASTSKDDAVVLDFLKQSTKYLDTLDFVERYAWFGYFRKEDGSNYNLLDGNGNFNALGNAYINNQ